MRTFTKAMLVVLVACSAMLAGCGNNDSKAEKASEQAKTQSMAPATQDDKGAMQKMGEDMDNAYQSSKQAADDMKDAASGE
ncbi:MAG: hypothetical protein R3292_01935 [Alcanivorax sp.]|nr:hypothetical protein [Alcanivorax sp.]